MSNTKHTPGPWLSEYDDNGFYFVHKDAMYAPSPCILATGGESEEDKANSILAAAAPELLEALKIALPFIDSHFFPKEKSTIEAAIKKATT